MSHPLVAASTKSTADDPQQETHGEPIIEQSPTVTVGDRTFVILPGPVATISARKTDTE
jgi:hypothetical protein